MNATTRTGKAVHRPSDAQLREQLLERLDAAMHAWATRDREAPEIVARRLDELRDAWAAARMALGDELRIEPPAPPATAPAPYRPSRPAPRRRGDVDRPKAARARKAPDDQARERYIVTEYAKLIRKGSTRSEALTRIAADVREGRYIRDWRLRFLEGNPPYGDTYSAKSVARVLKKYAAS